MGYVFAVLWIGSFVSGWLHVWPWLAVPPLAALWASMGLTGRGIRALRKAGADKDMEAEYVAGQFGSVFRFVFAQAVIGGALFLLALLIRSVVD